MLPADDAPTRSRDTEVHHVRPTYGDETGQAGGPDDSGPAPACVGRYRLLGELARGGMGVVYRARDTDLSREVAVKLMRAEYRPISAAVRRFTDEATITGRLQHPGIPPVHEVGELPDGSPFLAMKLIRGRTMAALLKNRSTPSADRGRFVAVFEHVCQAVAYAHAHGVIHRDLKPANVMVGEFGEVQVMDWGLAKVLTPPGPTATDATTGADVRPPREADAATRVGSALGTPAYMPPEQAIGAIDRIDERSDVFGLGAILCEILTGKPPYIGDGAESVRQLAAGARLDDAHARLAACGAEQGLVALARRCLSADPADRPRTAGDAGTAVAGLRAQAEDRARRAEIDRAAADVRAGEQRKRQRILLATGVVLAAAAVGLVLVRVESSNRRQQLDYAEFTDEQQRHTQYWYSSLSAHLQSLETLASFREVADSPDAKQVAFAGRLFRYSGNEVVAVVWVPRVGAAERAEYERTRVPVRDWKPDGSRAPAGTRGEYYPLSDLLFGDGRTAFGRGTDLSTHPAFATTFAEAASGNPAATRWVRYPSTIWADEGGPPEPRRGGDWQNSPRVPGRSRPSDLISVILHPAFSPAPSGVKDIGPRGPSRQLAGFYAVVLNVDEMVREIDRSTTHGVHAQVRLTDDSPDPEGYYPGLWRDCERGPPAVAPVNPSASYAGRGYYYYRRTTVGNRQWMLEVGDSPPN